MELITFKKNSEKNRQILGVIGADGSVFSFMQV